MSLTVENIEEIKIRFAKAETVEDLASLLSYIYAIKFPKRNEKNPVMIQAKHLNYYAFKAENRYKQFSIPKKSGGIRTISAPRYKLKTIQKCINEILNIVFTPHFAATGFVPNKSILDNAKLHVGKQFVYNTDLKDFFPSVDFRRIKSVLGLRPFNLININKSQTQGKEHLAFLIANLCCENGCLPQGAPTSPTLTNVVCQRLDRNLFKFAKSIKATYSRYADDITFSANKPIFNSDFDKKLAEIIAKENFKINEAKTRLQNGGERQSVTGIVVNKKPNVDRNFIKDIRFWLMCWSKFDYEATHQKFLVQFPNKKGFLRYGGATPQFYNYLNGKILFFGMVRGANDAMFLKFKTNFDLLYSKIQRNDLASIPENISENEIDLGLILDIWEKEGIEKAMEKFELKL